MVGAISIKIIADFVLTSPQKFRLEFEDIEGNVIVLEGALSLEEVEVRGREAFGGFMLRSRQVPEREYTARYDGNFVELHQENAKSAQGTRPRRVIELLNTET